MYHNMDNVLYEINRQFISLPKEEVKRNKAILEYVVQTLINRMKLKDPLFDKMFRRIFYGGSFYDGLRVGKPVEFDLDLLLDLPKYAQPTILCSEIPGYVKLRMNNFESWMRQPEAMPGYRTFFDSDFYLRGDEVLKWMQGLLHRTMNDFSKQILVPEEGYFKVSYKNNEPALTLEIVGPGVEFDVDLVPCFVFSINKWPGGKYRSNPFPSTWPEFFIVPKKPKDNNDSFWRLSFQEQERELLKKKERLRSTVKLIKKMRDKMDNKCIASYYIKTIFLHLLDKKELTFWNKPLSEIFMISLGEYLNFIKQENIPYYWNSDFNLIGTIEKRETLEIIRNTLRRIIRNVENNPDRPDTIAKYLHKMDMEKMLEEYRQAQRIRISRKLTNKAMAFVEFKKVQVQDGSGPIFKDVTMLIKKGTLPDDPGIVVFYNKPAKFNLMIVGSSFVFNDKLPCDNLLTIIFDGEEERREDISLTFATKELKDNCAAALIHYLKF